MAKENGQRKQEAPAAYFKSLTIENVKCFKGKHTIDLSDGKGKPAQWTVILGNNNTGKTTVLKCLAGLELYEGVIKIVGNSESYRVHLYSIRNFFSEPQQSEFKIQSQLFLANHLRENLSQGTFSEVPEAPTKIAIAINGDLLSSVFDGALEIRVISYGASRKTKPNSFSDEKSLAHASLFDNEDLPNSEQWLLGLFLSEKLGRPEARIIRELATEVLSSGLLPDVYEVRLNSREMERGGFENFVEYRTDFGWIRLNDLGYGYQTMAAWVLDLMTRMVDRYPGPNPLAQPAIVLVDEIDLHLHPDWQRKIIAHLTKYFPNTQFIVTAHSPLIVQSAEEVNLVILKKEGEAVYVEQPKIRSFRGWTVEEILTDLMQLKGQTMSKTYLDLREQFDEALDEDNYEKARDAYEHLDGILHPTSSQRKLMKIQMTSLSPAEAV